MANLVFVKPKTDSFTHVSFPTKSVLLYHPLYNFDYLASLPTVDATEAGKQGVHFGLVTECFKIFSGGQEGDVYKLDVTTGTVGEMIEMAYDGAMEEGRYCWVLRTTNGSDWAIVPRFRNWIPVSNAQMPEAWQQAFPSVTQAGIGRCTSMSRGVAARDQECRVSLAGDALQGTHTIPRAEQEWFESNGRILDDVIGSLDSMRNGVGLAAGLRSLYDQKVWCLVPKRGKVVVQFFEFARESYALYSNRVSQPLKESFPSLFYARLAWVILGRVEDFFRSKFAEKVRVRVGDKGRYREMVFSSWTKEAKDVKGKAKDGNEDKLSRKRSAEDEAGGDSSRSKRKETLADMMEGVGEVGNRSDDEPNTTPPASPPPKTERLYEELPEELKLEVYSWVEGEEMRKLADEALRLERARNGIEATEEVPERDEPVPWQLRYPFDQMGRWVEQAKRLKEGQRTGATNAE